MLEVHANHWLYGTSFNELSEEKINIGVFTPYVIENFLKNNDKIELQVFRIEVSEKERMLRQLNRETNPDVKEIVRRFGTDLEDFANLNFDYKIIKNDEIGDIEEAVNEIIAAFGQNQLNDKA
jgi:guanylate kinase